MVLLTITPVEAGILAAALALALASALPPVVFRVGERMAAGEDKDQADTLSLSKPTLTPSKVHP